MRNVIYTNLLKFLDKIKSNFRQVGYEVQRTADMENAVLQHATGREVYRAAKKQPAPK